MTYYMSRKVVTIYAGYLSIRDLQVVSEEYMLRSWNIQVEVLYNIDRKPIDY